MARKIIVLNQVATPVIGSTDLNYNVAFWLAVGTPRQPFYANANATTAVVGAIPAELQAIQAGQIVETIVLVSYPNATPIGTIIADLIARYNASQTAFNVVNPWNRYGTSWDGTTWTQVTVT